MGRQHYVGFKKWVLFGKKHGVWMVKYKTNEQC